MTAPADEPKLTSFLVKVASRCNLDCDYCYVYHHADQSWRAMPEVLSPGDREAFATRLSSYVAHARLRAAHGAARQQRDARAVGLELDDVRS